MAYAMAIICIRLSAEANSFSKIPQSLDGELPCRSSVEETLKMGDYRDILSLTRVLVYGPESKADADLVIER